VIIAVTAHRHHRLPGAQNPMLVMPAIRVLMDALVELADAVPPEEKVFVVHGMASGGDIYFGGAALLLKKEGLPFESVARFPYPGFGEDRFTYVGNPAAKKWFERVKAGSIDMGPVSPHRPANVEEANVLLMDRNIDIVNRIERPTDRGICLFDGKPHGGAFNTLAYAESKGLRDRFVNVYDAFMAAVAGCPPPTEGRK
jgi:hypothetical protein